MKLGATPTITVLMCCYNAARWLDESIYSVMKQTFTDFEFIIVDDGSVDNSLEIIQRHAAADSRIIVVSKLNGGPADARNAGVKIARGEWIAVIDADDICEPTRLEKQITFALKNSNLVYVGAGLTIIDDVGRKLMLYRYPTRHITLVQHLRTGRKFPPHSSAFYRAKTLVALGGFRLGIHAEDFDLWLRLSEVGQLACLREPLVQIRKHADNISNATGGRQQLVDARMAAVSHWLRLYRVADPFEADAAGLSLFKTWIQVRILESGLFELQDFRTQLHFLADQASHSLAGMLRLLVACVGRPVFVFKLIQHRLVGDNLSHRLALEWIKKTDLC